MNTFTSRAWVMGILVSVLTGPAAHAADMAKPTPEMEAMMKKAQAYGTPGGNHRVLDPLAGNWAAKASFWMKPGDKAQMSDGTNVNTWVLGGRFLRQEYKGTWQGQPFEGLGFTGYDNFRGEYQTVWLDSMMTGTMIAAGSYELATNTLKISGTFSCPMTGNKAQPMRAELKIVSNDKHVYTSYDKTPEGKEFKSMEIVYTRVK